MYNLDNDCDIILPIFILPFQGTVFYMFSFTQGVAPSGRCHWAMLFRAFSPKMCKSILAAEFNKQFRVRKPNNLFRNLLYEIFRLKAYHISAQGRVLKGRRLGII